MGVPGLKANTAKTLGSGICCEAVGWATLDVVVLVVTNCVTVRVSFRLSVVVDEWLSKLLLPICISRAKLNAMSMASNNTLNSMAMSNAIRNRPLTDDQEETKWRCWLRRREVLVVKMLADYLEAAVYRAVLRRGSLAPAPSVLADTATPAG